MGTIDKTDKQTKLRAYESDAQPKNKLGKKYSQLIIVPGAETEEIYSEVWIGFCCVIKSDKKTQTNIGKQFSCC